MNTVSDLSYNRLGTPNYVYVLEKNQYIPFLVLTDDYNGNTLLIRRDVVAEPRCVSDYSAYYGNSGIDLYLNSEYINCLSEVSPCILTSTIGITSEDSLGESKTETETIDRKVFLLSCNEVGIEDSVNIAQEGEMLEYFQNPENRTAYIDDKVSSWWLRTPNTYYLSCTYVIGDNNKLGFTNAYDKNGIRPAFCVKSDMLVELNSDIVEGQSVYVFSFEN